MHKILGLMAVVILVTACGEFSYKRGATVTQLENTRQSCQAKGSADAVKKCMEDKGWTIQQLDSFEIFTVNEPDSDEQKEVVAAENSSELSAENAQQSEATQAVVAHKQQKIESSTKSSVKPDSKTSIKSKTKVASSNPLDTYVVSSWWKSGVRPDAFQVDSNMCVEKLGEAHKPIGKTQTVTVGFISCMNEKGWKALKKLR